MTKSRGLICVLGCGLLLLGIVAPAHSQDATGEYVAPSQASHQVQHLTCKFRC